MEWLSIKEWKVLQVKGHHRKKYSQQQIEFDNILFYCSIIHFHCQIYVSLTHWGLLTSHGIMNQDQHGSGNGLVPEDTKPLQDPMVKYYQMDP